MIRQQDVELEKLSFSDPETIEALWQQFYPRLKAAVRQHVRSIRTPVANESEIALSAFHSFVRQAKDGRFPNLADHDSLWRLLKTIAVCKAKDLRRNLHAQKRGGGRAALNQSDLAARTGRDKDFDVGGRGGSPSMDLEVSDIFTSLLESLPDERHRDVVLLKLQGASIAVIADCLSVSTRTIQRLLTKIEDQWRDELC